MKFIKWNTILHELTEDYSLFINLNNIIVDSIYDQAIGSKSYHIEQRKLASIKKILREKANIIRIVCKYL